MFQLSRIYNLLHEWQGGGQFMMSNLSWKGTTLRKGPLNMFSSSELHMYCRPGLWCLLFYLSYANEKCSWPRHNHDTCLLSKVTDVTTILSTCFQRRRKIWRAFLLYCTLIEDFSLLDERRSYWMIDFNFQSKVLSFNQGLLEF